MKKILCVIPTLNAAKTIQAQLKLLMNTPMDILIIDSSSDDDTLKIVSDMGVDYIKIKREEFDHGGTRRLGAEYKENDIVVFLTQDALPYDKTSVEKLIESFEDGKVGAAYGRQLPYPNETLFGTHLRLFNYPPQSHTRSYQDREKYGIKCASLSDSFAAYNTKALKEVGYFKSGLIFGEDMHVGAKLLKAGYTIAYKSDAMVYHSHGYTLMQELRRYFDMGVFHRNESWILDEFGTPEGEGKKYILSEFKYMVTNRRYGLIFEYILRNLMKYFGYKLGKNYERLPLYLTKKLSMNTHHWNK